MKFRVHEMPYLAKLGWDVSSLETAQHYGHVLFSDNAEKNLRKWEKELRKWEGLPSKY